MSYGPERIWAWHNHEVTDEGGWQVEERYNGEVKYIRADLADAKDQRIKDLEAALWDVFECDDGLISSYSPQDIARAALKKGETK